LQAYLLGRTGNASQALHLISSPLMLRGPCALQVYLLGRMGNASQALHLIIDKLEDIPQVRGRLPGAVAAALSTCRCNLSVRSHNKAMVLDLQLC